MCPSENTLVAFMDGALDEAARREIEAHIDGCSACAALMATLGRAVETEAPEEPTGQWGRYEILSRLGAGAMGTVYAAKDTVLEREIALKILHPRAVVEPERLWREARALARISHPNVVLVHDAGKEGASLYIAMELVRGGALSTWLKTPRTAHEILDAFRQAGQGLAAAHAAGVLHRDFKPDNVLMGADGVVRVSDFGLASKSTEVTSGAVLGTPAYMAPEQRAGDLVGPPADQYSFCVALQEALGTNAPRWIDPILARGLETDPARRFGSMNEIVALLEAHLRPKTDVQYRVNAILQAIAFVFHALIFAVFVQQAMKEHDTTAAPMSTAASVKLAVVVAYVVAWLPLGMLWTPLNAWGLWRQRRWAAVSTMLYAVTALPTCIGTPLGIYALATLFRRVRK